MLASRSYTCELDRVFFNQGTVSGVLKSVYLGTVFQF
jgi:hypothetical protein